jgi:hypothetical protein
MDVMAPPPSTAFGRIVIQLSHDYPVLACLTRYSCAGTIRVKVSKCNPAPTILFTLLSRGSRVATSSFLTPSGVYWGWMVK